MSLPQIKIYTDGSCSPNPGPGGWGAVILPEKGKKRELSGKVAKTTNNRMELQAALEALKSLPVSSGIELYTDSRYLKNGITSWIDNWRRQKWLTTDKEKVKNRDLWESLDLEMNRHQVQWLWVKGHADDTYNERADELAVKARGREVLPLQDQTAVHIFLGITWRQKVQIGSWAAVLKYQEHYKAIGGIVEDSSANCIHIQSATTALRSVKRKLPVHLYTSSGYLKEGAGNWIQGWQRNQWKTRDGKVVSNKGAWQELSILLQEFSVNFHVIDKEMPPCHCQEAKKLAQEWVIDPSN
jgi:ribonuclease HI